RRQLRDRQRRHLPDHASPQPSGSDVNDASASELVVVVEDDAAIAEGLALNLKLQGYRTEVAGDGDAALARIQEAHPDLVLLDISLPKRSGISVLETLRNGGDH